MIAYVATRQVHLEQLLAGAQSSTYVDTPERARVLLPMLTGVIRVTDSGLEPDVVDKIESVLRDGGLL